MSTSHTPSPEMAGQCEHLGTKDDPGTCLAFPSTWNYCHHAKPPDSVRLEHQRQYCQSTQHGQCLVFQREKVGPLPPDIRGRHVSKTHHRRASARVPVLLVLLALAIALIWLATVKGLFGRTLSPEFRGVASDKPPAAAVSPVSPNVAPPTMLPFVPPLAAASTAMPTPTNFSITPTYSDPSPSTATPVSTPLGSCGHQLDEPFGPETKLLIHKVGGGDSLNRYEIMYRTSVEAIVGINYPFPIPLRSNRMLVIPLDQKDVGGLPVFEPYLVSNRNTAIQTMAFKVSADLLAFEKYNGFDESCQNFVGWVVAPRERPLP